MKPRQPRRTLTAILAPDGLGALGPEGVHGIILEGPWRNVAPEEKLGALLEYLALVLARGVTRFPTRPRRIIAGGGLTAHRHLLQRIADLTRIPVIRLTSPDATLHGAAMLAGLTRGIRIDPLPCAERLEPRGVTRDCAAALDRFEALLHARRSPIPIAVSSFSEPPRPPVA